MPKTLRHKPVNHWFIPVLNELKLAKHHLERVWSQSHSSDNQYFDELLLIIILLLAIKLIESITQLLLLVVYLILASSEIK
jgi:hypothetical protein